MEIIKLDDKSPVSSADLKTIASTLSNALKERTIDPFLLRRNLNVVKKIEENISSALTEAIRAEADKYPEKTFNLHGAEYTKAEVGTSYSYENCGDPVWARLKAEFDEVKKKLDKREKVLRSIDGHATMVDEDTGEVITVYPPVKKSTSSVTCKIL